MAAMDSLIKAQHEEKGVHLASLRWEEIGPFLLIFTFFVLSGVAKIAFHHAHFISSRIPESCLLMIVGIGFGALIEFGGLTMLPPFTSEFFFHYLLPPIIMEAAYSLHHKAFLDNIRIILFFAVIGTLFNFLLIGGCLFGVNELGLMGSEGVARVRLNETELHNLTTVEIFTFSSLISAVDPVAVLAIFQEVGVNSELYYIVFGESLLNDGVAVVLYNMMNSFAEIQAEGDDVSVEQILLGCLSFLTVALGGLTLGVTVGLLTGLLTKATSNVSVIEPLLVMGMAFIAYYLSELFHWSGIISLIGCGIVQAHYSFSNISPTSLTTIDHFSKMLSSTMDSVIFLYLGKALLGQEDSWTWNVHPGFVSWTLAFCLVIRFVGVFFFTFLLNKFRAKKINLQEQFIMAYGGLRGAVGFALVISIKDSIVPSADMFVSTTLIVVLFTVGLQGGTIKPLVDLLNIDRENEDQKTLLEELNDSATDALLSGMNHVIGRFGFIHFQEKFNKFDEKYLKRIFCKDDRDHDMKKLFEERIMADHLANIYDPLQGIQKVKVYTNEGFDLQENIHLPIISDESQSNTNMYLKPFVRRDSVSSNISSISRRSRSVRLSTYDPVKVRNESGDKEGMNNLQVLKYGLARRLSETLTGQDDNRHLSAGHVGGRKISSSSGYYPQTYQRSRTLSDDSEDNNESVHQNVP